MGSGAKVHVLQAKNDILKKELKKLFASVQKQEKIIEELLKKVK